MTNRRHSAFRRAAWVAIFAMLLQALIPALHHPARMAMADTLSLGGGKNLCLAPGGIPANSGAPDKEPHHHLPACAICYALHALGGFAPPQLPAVAILRSSTTGFHPAAVTIVSIRLPYASQQPRAPPFA